MAFQLTSILNIIITINSKHFSTVIYTIHLYYYAYSREKIISYKNIFVDRKTTSVAFNFKLVGENWHSSKTVARWFRELSYFCIWQTPINKEILESVTLWRAMDNNYANNDCSEINLCFIKHSEKRVQMFKQVPHCIKKELFYWKN